VFEHIVKLFWTDLKQNLVRY